MTTAPKATAEPTRRSIIVDLGQAIASVRTLSGKALAWNALLKTDEHGVTSVIPYTLEAIDILDRAYEEDGTDIDLIHHLAIAYHAWAWDLEIEDSDDAFPVWEKALGYWKILQAQASFWQALSAKGETLGMEFDKESVQALRQNLLIDLIDLHVDFVCRYDELKRLDRAAQHIALIQRAQIPPALRKALEERAFETVRSSLPVIFGKGGAEDGLRRLDSFLSLFPAHIPALQYYVETARAWAEQASPVKDWLLIQAIEDRVIPRAAVLRTSETLDRYPLARAALVDLAEVMVEKNLARAEHLARDRQQNNIPVLDLNNEEYECYQSALSWLDTDLIHMQAGSTDLLRALQGRIAIFNLAISFAANEEEALRLLDTAVGDAERAVTIATPSSPNEPIVRRWVAQELAQRAAYRLTRVETDLRASLESAERDLEKALVYTPGDAPEMMQLTEQLAFVKSELTKL